MLIGPDNEDCGILFGYPSRLRSAGLSCAFYRLMDVDLILQAGMTLYAGNRFAGGTLLRRCSRLRLERWFTHAAAEFACVGTCGGNHRHWAYCSEPLKRAIQVRVDRIFDQKRFDYRETLVEFGRGLNSQTDLRALLDSIVERLPQTLLVTRMAVFHADVTVQTKGT